MKDCPECRRRDEALRQAKNCISYVVACAPGYDWNADPAGMTLVVGRLYEVIEAALSPAPASEEGKAKLKEIKPNG